MNNYYKNYLKYKIKYLKLKNQIGGKLGTEPCPKKFDEHNPPSILDCLLKYNCTFTELKEKNPLQMSEFNYEQYNNKMIFMKKSERITMIDLRSRGFPLSILIEKNFPLDKLIKEARFPLHEFKEAGFNAKVLGGFFTLKDLLAVGFTIKEIADAVFSINIIKDAGITALHLRQAGVSAQKIRNLGFTLEELRATGITVSELKSEEYPLKKIRELGFTLQDLLDGGYKFDEIKQLKYNLQELLDTGINVKTLRDMGYSYIEIKKFGFSAQQIFCNGATLEEMIGAEIELKDLVQFFHLHDLKQKFKIKDLKYYFKKIEDLKSVGFKALALKHARFFARDLKSAGYKLDELMAVNFEPDELKSAGYTLQELISGNYDPFYLKKAFKEEIDENPKLLSLLKSRVNRSFIVDLKTGFGYTANDFKDAGYEANQLCQNFTLPELKEAGYTDKELKGLVCKQF